MFKTSIIRSFLAGEKFTFAFLSNRHIHTNVGACFGISKYRTPIREIILNNNEMKEKVERKKILSDFSNKTSDKNEIYFQNRNPRHLELLGFNKPAGFTTLYEPRNFYNKLNLKVTNNHVKAFVENINGEILCYASTTEHYIAKELYSTTDVMAVVNIALILAHRMKEIGIERVHWFTRLDRTTEKIREFEGILRNSGIILQEASTRVLEGPSQTIPPPRRKRVLPNKLNRGWKVRGTMRRRLPLDYFDD